MLSRDPKPRLRWTPELHDRFVDAVAKLGGPDSSLSSSVFCPSIYPFQNPCFILFRCSFAQPSVPLSISACICYRNIDLEGKLDERRRRKPPSKVYLYLYIYVRTPLSQGCALQTGDTISCSEFGVLRVQEATQAIPLIAVSSEDQNLWGIGIPVAEAIRYELEVQRKRNEQVEVRPVAPSSSVTSSDSLKKEHRTAGTEEAANEN
ncbi:hypothetical protein BHM03_00026120 [Ensete ventricosum]|nr:hypothetical protein BHM03_00026120 [Ensete ventricosum]